MDKHQMLTHDFMNISSFSQLPFKCSTPIAEKASGPRAVSSIRLFGVEFAGKEDDVVDSKTDNTNKSPKIPDDKNSESSRRFECPYCYRNFPTSQALGGHQNAHRRERQQEKRDYIQSMMQNRVTHKYGHMLAPIASYPSSWNRCYVYSSTTQTPTTGSMVFNDSDCPVVPMQSYSSYQSRSENKLKPTVGDHVRLDLHL